QIRHGRSVTDAAFDAGYESVEGFSRAFSRAFGRPPSALPAEVSHWLPAPNGIHFHPPMSLWVHSKEQPMSPLTEQLVQHDIDDTRVLLDVARQVPDAEYRRARLPAGLVTTWEGDEQSVAEVLEHLIFTKEVWLAAIEGGEAPIERGDAPETLIDRFEAVAPRWLATVR